MNHLRHFMGSLAGMLLASGVTGCGAPHLPHAKYIYNAAITVKMPPVTNINPITERGESNNLYSAMVYGSLITLNAQGQPRPLLVKSWESNPSHTVYTFALNPYAKWWSGRPVTAQDVAWTLRYYQDTAPSGSVRGRELADLDSIHVLSATRFTMTLSRSNSEFVTTVLSPQGRLWILPGFLLDRLAPDRVIRSDFLNKVRNTVGNGPYRPLRFTKLGLRFVANPHFVLGAPKVKYMRWRWKAPSLKKGQIAVVWSPTRLTLNPAYRIHSSVASWEWALQFNTPTHIPNLARIMAFTTSGRSLPGQSLIPTGAGLSLSALMSQAGYRHSTQGWVSSSGTPFTLTLASPAKHAASTENILIHQWHTAGLQAKVVPPDRSTPANIELIKISALGSTGSKIMPLFRPYEYWYIARNLLHCSPNNWAPFENVQQWQILARPKISRQ